MDKTLKNKTIYFLINAFSKNELFGFSQKDIKIIKRMSSGNIGKPFWLLYSKYIPSELKNDDDSIRIWFAIIKGMSIMYPLIHGEKDFPGKVLAISDYGENKFKRLLGSVNNNIYTSFIETVMHFERNGKTVNWYKWSDFLTEEDNSLLELSRDYYLERKRL